MFGKFVILTNKGENLFSNHECHPGIRNKTIAQQFNALSKIRGALKDYYLQTYLLHETAVVPFVGNSGLPYRSSYVGSLKQNSLKSKKWALLVHHFPSPFGRVLFKTLNLLSQKDYFKAILILLDL